MSTIHKDSNGNESAKRIYGGIGISFFFLMSIIIAPIYSIYTGNDIGINASQALSTAGYVCAALLTAGVLENIKLPFGKNK